MKKHAPYMMVYDGDSFIDGIEHESLESAVCDAEDTLIMWASDKMHDWKWNEEKQFPEPTPEQIEDWDYMIYNCGCYVVRFDEESGEYESIDYAVWPKSDEQLDKLGWMFWEDYVKKYMEE